MHTWRIFSAISAPMTESQPEISETARDTKEEDLIEESAFEVEAPTNTPRERARNHLQTLTNEKHRQAKGKSN